MKATFVVLAVAAVLAFAEGTTPEGLKTYIAGLGQYNEYRTAKLINADKITEVPLKANNDNSFSGEAQFTPTSEPMAAGALDPKCGNLLGFQLQDRYFCGLSYMKIVQNLYLSNGNEEIFGIYLQFESPDSPNDILRIKTYIFTTPDGLKGEALQDWAKEKQMIVSPFDEEDLKGLYESGTISLKLDWVAKLAEYGVYEEVPFPNNEENGFFYDASLRPIAVPSSVLSQLEKVYVKYMNDYVCSDEH